MATPKNILTATNTSTVSYKTVTKKTVVQNINIFNLGTSNISIFVNRIPASELGSFPNYTQTKHRVKYLSSIVSQEGSSLENLKFVLEAGDTISVYSPAGGVTFTVFIDGVEFD